MSLAALVHLAVHAALVFALAPLLQGIVNRTKAWFAGRRGPPLAQPYFDLWRLLAKGAVYSTTTTVVFRLAPVVALAALLTTGLLVPMGGWPAPLAFAGDLFLVAGLLALARFALVLAALDTGSSFTGMGASREVWFAALAEPALLVSLAALARGLRHDLAHDSLSAIYGAMSPATFTAGAPFLLLVAGALLLVFLAENGRIPVDDPNTHLELTMIHEVMILDHSGPDLAFLLYGQALKLQTLGVLLVGVLLPVRTGVAALDLALAVAGLVLLAVAVGCIESLLARLRLARVAQMLTWAGALAVAALVLEVS